MPIAPWLTTALILLLAAGTAGQDPGQQAPAHPTAEVIRARIAQLESDEQVAETVKTGALQAYRESLEALETAKAHLP